MEKEIISKEFDTVREKVLYLLETDEECRNSDNRLLSRFLCEFTNYRIINIDEISPLLKNVEDYLDKNSNSPPIAKFSMKALEFKLSKLPNLKLFPSFETVRRVRQKLQNDEEKFIPTIQEVAEKRNIRKELIREYFIEKRKECEGKI